ncbi:MAG: universal stress protein [Gammaproteobacteria bacterium]|nr:universal stress protein [Gammaproteobacteria bacterium]
MNDTVLCVVEPENYPDDVAARAAWLAKLFDCELELTLSDPSMSFLGESFVFYADMQRLADTIKQEQDAILHRLASSAEELGIAVRTSTFSERPEADIIADKAESCNALFVVKGTHYHSPSERASLAHTDWQLIRDLGRPLWFAKPTPWKDRTVAIAAVDPTHRQDKLASLDREIIRRAQEIADKCDGKMLLFHSYQRLEEIGSQATWKFKPEKLPIDELDEKIREEHRKALDKLAEEFGIPPKAVHQLPGRTEELLPTFARTNGASLVVMGALARTGLKKRFVGSTAAKVLDHLPCDVLVVHS